MPTVVKTFTYTGTLQQANIPAGTTSIDVYLWGGAGGGGGSDAGGPGGTGAAGHHVKKTSFRCHTINTMVFEALGPKNHVLTRVYKVFGARGLKSQYIF